MVTFLCQPQALMRRARVAALGATAYRLRYHSIPGRLISTSISISISMSISNSEQNLA